MGFMESLFGSSGGYSGEDKQAGADLRNQYMANLNQFYGNDSYKQDVGAYTENMSNNLRNWQAGNNMNLASRGFNGNSASGASPFMMALAKYQAEARDKQRRGYLQGMSGALPFYQYASGLNYKNPSQGAIGSIAGVAGAYYGAR